MTKSAVSSPADPHAASGSEHARIEIDVAPAARAGIAALGRTEDVRFSPDNARLAIAGYARNTCFLFDVAIDRSGERPVLWISDYLELRSDHLAEPHGFDFIGNDTLVVANRAGAVTVFEVPRKARQDRILECEPLRVIARGGLLRKLGSPGSVCVVQAGDGRAEILVCNNYKNRVTRHVFRLNRRTLPDDRIALENRLNVPDGIAISPDRAWVAVSNHMTASVLVFDNRAGLKRSAEPVGELTGVAYPHGLRFSPDGRRLYVADAGAPLLHVYETGGDWRGERAPLRSVTVLDEETFRRGQVNPEEGGPKGLDIDATGTVLALTCEEQALTFFHLPDLLA